MNNELVDLTDTLRDYQAGFDPEQLTDENVCLCKNNVDTIISYLKKVKASVDENIKGRGITEAGVWDITQKEVNTTRLDQAKVKKVLTENGGLEEYQTTTKSFKLNIKINTGRAIQKSFNKK